MKLSLTFGKRELSLGFGAAKSFDAATAAWLRGEDSSDGSGAGMTNAYQQSTWVYSCIAVLAKQIAMIPLRVSRGERGPAKAGTPNGWRRKDAGEDLIESGPLVDLLAKPHPNMSRFEFWHLALAWLELRGEFFASPLNQANEVVSLDMPGAGKQIKKLAVLKPESLRELVSANMLEGWQYTGDPRQPLATQALLPANLITAKLSNPWDFWRGMSPLSVARTAANTDFASAKFMQGLMLNNADTGVIVRTDQQLDPEQREQMLAALRARKRKAGTADRPLLLWGGAEVVKPTLSSTDMQFLENRKFNRQEICAIFGVPQEVLGFTEDANRSVGDAARLNFIENNVAAVCELLEAAIEPLAKAFDPNFYVWFDLDALPIMQRARQQRFVTAKDAMTTMGVPLNTVNELFDLGLPGDLPHGETVFLPFSLQEFGKEPELPETAPADSTPPSGTNTDSDEPASSQEGKPVADFFAGISRLVGQMARTNVRGYEGHGHVCSPNPGYEAALGPWVNLNRSALRRFFFEQRARVLAALEQAKPEIGKQKAVAEIRALDFSNLFDAAKENSALLLRLEKLLKLEFSQGAKQLGLEVGVPNFEIGPGEALQYLIKRKNEIESVNGTTFDKLKASLLEGLGLGESYDQLADRVKGIFADCSERRAEVIALTETNIAINSGRFGAMKALHIERKGWQTSHLEGTRASHWINEQTSVKENGIPLDQPWPNGCMYPGDPNGEPEEVINCRCFGYAVIPT